MNKSQLGYLEISEGVMEDFWYNNKEFVPLEIDARVSHRTIRYLCYSKHFKELKEAMSIPTYTIEFKCNELGVVHFLKVTEVKE